MTYNEWRDELKSNLLSVSESERRRVLDYYAEAYADRRDAGYTENEIINDFGAPYDAAHRILADSDAGDGYYDEPINRRPAENGAYYGGNDSSDRKRRHERRDIKTDRRTVDREEYFDEAPPPPPPRREEQRSESSESRNAREKDEGLPMWLFVILCILLAAPLFGLIMGMAGITIGFCAAPFLVIITGVSNVGAGVGSLVAGYLGHGLILIGTGTLVFGLGLVLMPLFFNLVKLMWKAFRKVFRYVKSFFGKRCA